VDGVVVDPRLNDLLGDVESQILPVVEKRQRKNTRTSLAAVWAEFVETAVLVDGYLRMDVDLVSKQPEVQSKETAGGSATDDSDSGVICELRGCPPCWRRAGTAIPRRASDQPGGPLTRSTLPDACMPLLHNVYHNAHHGVKAGT
jgi:hypothetical protein